MSLLDQFRRPDRGTPPPVENQERTGEPEEAPAESSVAVAEESEPEDEEDKEEAA